MEKLKRPSDAQLKEMAERAENSTRNFSALTYQEGVKDALLWALGQYDDPPLVEGE